MFFADRQKFARLLAGVLLLLGCALLVFDISKEALVETTASFAGPTTIGDSSLHLRERPTADGVFVDVIFGDAVFAGTQPVTVVENADPKQYLERYGSRFALVTPASETGVWHLLDVTRSITAAHRRIEINPAGGLREVPAAQVISPARSLLPAPTLILLAIALFIARGQSVSMPAGPTLLLVLLTAAFGALLAWPIMLRTGPAQFLPAAVLGLGATALAALAAGRRAQRWLYGQPHWRRMLRGAVVACVLLGVFVAVTVNIQGFIAPVFRPPGQALTPGDWFMQDFVRPTFGLMVLGGLPAVIGGTLYGLSQRQDRRLDA